METLDIRQIVSDLQDVLQNDTSNTFNYARYLLIDKAPYLDAFIDDRPFPPFEVEIQMSSMCNLHCRWCIGEEVQQQKKVLRLPNNITKDNIDAIVTGIINYRVEDLNIESVKFSGFIGEPLVIKDATLKAMRQLACAGVRVGLFTNGILMSEDTWGTIINISYVHVSLDAGPLTYTLLKEAPEMSCSDTFNTVLNNIKGLAATRQKCGSERSLRINVGFVIVPGNYSEIHKATQLVKEAGADSIRFKCDIGKRHDLEKAGLVSHVFKEINRVMKDFHAPPIFSVHAIHSKEEIQNRSYAAWQCEDGCYYQHFLGTVGSDGNVYLCDHNTMPAGIPLGNSINESFGMIWRSDRRRFLSGGIRYTCQSPVCPPFGNRANLFLRKISEIKHKYGKRCLQTAISEIRSFLK